MYSTIEMNDIPLIWKTTLEIYIGNWYHIHEWYCRGFNSMARRDPNPLIKQRSCRKLLNQARAKKKLFFSYKIFIISCIFNDFKLRVQPLDKISHPKTIRPFEKQKKNTERILAFV